jgi:hypothetical protein
LSKCFYTLHLQKVPVMFCLPQMRTECPL